MSLPPHIQEVTPENAAQFAQQANSAANPLSPIEITAIRGMIKTTEKSDISSKMQNGGGGGGMSDSERIVRLETHFQYIERDLSELKQGQKEIADKLSSLAVTLSGLPTKGDLNAWKLQWMGICVAAIALIVGGIIGGLVWIKPEAPQVIIQSGASQGSTVPSASSLPRPATPDAPAPRP